MSPYFPIFIAFLFCLSFFGLVYCILRDKRPKEHKGKTISMKYLDSKGNVKEVEGLNFTLLDD